MNGQNAVRAVICAGFLLLCCCLTGCNASFCGFRVGNQEELVFTCAENTAEQKEAVPEEEPEIPAKVSEESGSLTEESADPEKAVSEESSDGKINLNTADAEELMTLNGVGESRAKAILEYRSRNGAFQKIEDIMQIPGIKEGIFSKIKDQITVH